MMTKDGGNKADDQTSSIFQVPPSYPATPQPAMLSQGMKNSAQQMDPDASVVGKDYHDQLFAQCAVGNHERTKTYGICGIMTAIACFPCGLICLFTDTKYKCARCGVLLEEN